MKCQGVIIVFSCFFILASCQNKLGDLALVDSGNLTLNNNDVYFVFKEAVKYGGKYFPKGTYRSYYKDIHGSYFEAPSSIASNMMFSRGNAGGIYIKDTAFREAYIYTQDKHPQSIYVEGAAYSAFTYGGAAGFTYGGGAGFRIDRKLLPREVTDLIIIQ